MTLLDTALRDLTTLLPYAVRYALGRRTYAVDEVASIVIARSAELPAKDREVIARDIVRAAERGELGDPSHAERWSDALMVLRAVDSAQPPPRP